MGMAAVVLSEALLDVLRRRGDEWVPRSHLVQRLDADPDTIEAIVADLRREGYRIESDSVAGYRYLAREDRLIGREIQRALDTRLVGRRVVCLDCTASTNDDVWREAEHGAAEGLAVFAEEQTAGRGRFGRAWVSPRSAGLLCSVLLRPPLDIRHSHMLTAMAAVAVAEAVRDETRVAARIRWPNDIVVHERKVAGILVEGRVLSQGPAFALGIGINVNTRREDLPADVARVATSLAAEVGRNVSRVALARALLRSLERWYLILCRGDIGSIADRWRCLSSTLGQRVWLVEDGRPYRGTVLDLSIEDGLIVRLDSGFTRVFHPASVTLRMPPTPPVERADPR